MFTICDGFSIVALSSAWQAGQMDMPLSTPRRLLDPDVDLKRT